MPESSPHDPQAKTASQLHRWAAVFYGVTSYVLTMASELYMVAWITGSSYIPRTVDSGPPCSSLEAITVNVLLFLVFTIAHSGMARPGFKRLWTRIVPKCVERSTYILVASAVILFLIWQWRPLPYVLWHVDSPVGSAALQGLCWSGFLVMFISTYLIDHWNLFGVSQALACFTGKPLEDTPFQVPLFYRIVRHPMHLGFLTGVCCTPHMTVGHLLFAMLCIVYVRIGVEYEERDLMAVEGFGKEYRRYQQQVGMFLPSVRFGPRCGFRIYKPEGSRSSDSSEKQKDQNT